MFKLNVSLSLFMRTLRNLLASAFLAISFFLYPLSSFADKEAIFNKTYPITLLDESGKEIEKEVKIRASLDADTNILYLSVHPQDYSRKNWIGTEEQYKPVTRRHLNINHTFSRVFVLRPSRVKISEIQQKVFVVPQYKWVSDLEPYEKKESAQLLTETTDTLLDKVISEIPFLGKIYEKFIKDAKEKEEEYYDKIFEKINEEYVRTQIPMYIPKKFVGCTETAREYTIQFDTGNTEDEIPMFVWMSIAFGDSSYADSGSFPNKYGKLENILINFILNENKIKREELYDYFFHKDELRYLNVASKNIEGTGSNPAIITIKNMEQEEREEYEADRVIRIGAAEYVIKGKEEEGDLSFGIVQFETQSDREEFIKRKRSELKHPTFFKESVISFISNPTLEEVSHIGKFNEEYLSIYLDLILNYMNRTKMQAIFSDNEEESLRILKEIKEYHLKSEGE
jgi:hypothetical protein